ncbi:LysR family transcriptional regulator [Pseudemcibacter aquimaris]|uniref:LysR family transcriptional regulator n=1 Tax=Pseudemcibacter aquimaris TaxID=2857064 RepID=UPI002013BEF2|nr:LysR family transcriptional regulator [Pseudemcibacter aquimaris]MCC3860172.1 LysR family transcriptional regulator [Pseudemcibacter aquimaris]WDU57498.1 LysR family transcriptional regulator [Pseudemcibacter aquimaris]
MDNLRLMNIFSVVAESNGFAAAARRLAMSPPSVTRAVSELENELGAKLFHRTTRTVRLTEIGENYLQDVRRIIDDVNAANAAVTGLRAAPVGGMSVTAPVLFGQMYIAPTISKYLKKWPDTQIHALFLDRVVNMLEEGMDVAVRIGHLPDSNMRAVRVGQVRVITCASPKYLEKHGIPNHPRELTDHQTISSLALNPTPKWRFCIDGKDRYVNVKPRLTSTSNGGAISAACSGLGITRLISYQVAPDLTKGSLKTVLEEFELPKLPIHILHREEQGGSAKIREFIDMLKTDLRANPNIN